MSPKIVDKNAKRAEILDAAIRVFGAKGFHATRTEDIARQAGIANGTVYLYFASRDDILLAAFTRFAEQVSASVEVVVRADQPADERLRATVRALLSRVQAEPELSRLLLDFWTRGASGEAGTSSPLNFARIYADYRDTFGDLLDQAKAEGSVRADLREDTPTVLVGVIEGVLLQWLIAPDAVSPHEMSESVLDVLFTGLR